MKIGFVFNLKRSNAIEETEFDSPDVIEALSAALGSKGAEVIRIEMSRDGTWINRLCSENVDLIFNTAEGFSGVAREAYAPAVFDQLEIPYVGSGPNTCVLTLNKYLTNKTLLEHGVSVPESVFIENMEEIDGVASELSYPVFVKPNFEGTSKGITPDSKCDDAVAFRSFAGKSLADFREGLIVEQYIDGIDITVPYVEGIAEGVLDVVEYTGCERNGVSIYDYGMKNIDDSGIDFICPARISDHLKESIQEQMRVAVRVLGIKDMARADFRISEAGEACFIEINALPSMHPEAGFFAATALKGFDYKETISLIVNHASNTKGSPL